LDAPSASDLSCAASRHGSIPIATTPERNPDSKKILHGLIP
jgi:hypothetical protein